MTDERESVAENEDGEEEAIGASGSQEKPARKGRIYAMWCKFDKRVYYGLTVRSLPSRLAAHKSDAKSGLLGGLYETLRLHGADAFRMEQVSEDIVIPADGQSSIKHLKPFVAAAMRAHLEAHGPGSLLNVDDATAESRAATREKMRRSHGARTPADEKRKIAAGIETGRQRGGNCGSLSQTRGGAWKFVWTIDWSHRCLTFPTRELAEAQRLLIYPAYVVVSEEMRSAKIWKIYVLSHPSYRKSYVGKTTSSLPSRLNRHRVWAERRGDVFHAFMADNEPLAWRMTAIYTLYNVTAAQLSAVETLVISRYAPAQLWNIPARVVVPALQQWWSYTAHAPVRESRWYVTQKRTSDMAKRLAEEHKAKCENQGRVRFLQDWLAPITMVEGKRPIVKKFRVTEKRDEERAKSEAQAWLDDMRAKRAAASNAVAEAAIHASNVFFQSYGTPSSPTTVRPAAAPVSHGNGASSAAKKRGVATAEVVTASYLAPYALANGERRTVMCE